MDENEFDINDLDTIKDDKSPKKYPKKESVNTYIMNPKACIRFYKAVTLAKKLCDGFQKIDVIPLVHHRLNGRFRIITPSITLYDDEVKKFRDLIDSVDSVTFFHIEQNTIIEFRIRGVFIRI